MRAKFLYRNNFQFSFPITLKSFLIHFLEKHVYDVLNRIALSERHVQFHLIFKSHFSDLQQHLHLDIDVSQMSFEDLMGCMERNMEHLHFYAPISSFTIVASSLPQPTAMAVKNISPEIFAQPMMAS